MGNREDSGMRYEQHPGEMTITVKTVAIVAIALAAGAVMFPGCITREEAESVNMPIVLNHQPKLIRQAHRQLI